MPVGEYGQKITFHSVHDPDRKYTHYVYVRTQARDTIAKILARRGRPDMAQEVLQLNRDVRLPNGHFLRDSRQRLPLHTIIRLPGTLTQGDTFDVYPDDNRPVITGGYAKYDTVDRPGRVGINRFLGYDPLSMDITVQFEDYHRNDGHVVERDIAVLERMAGRGDYQGAALGPPAVVEITVTGKRGGAVPLIPHSYQWSPSAQSAPLYRISAIQWAAGALSDDEGRRIRAGATITVTQYTPILLAVRSATQRANASNRPATQ